MWSSNEEKKSFLFGLTLGIAIMALIAFATVCGIYFKDRDLSRGDNFGSEDNNVPVVNNAPTVNNKPTANNANIPLTGKEWIRGDKNAPVTIIEFTDMQCPFCQRFHETMKQVMANYSGKVRWVYKHFPLESIHPYAKKAAMAAECAGEQKKFWEFADYVYANQANLGDSDFFAKAANSVGINAKNLESCLSSEKYKSKVEADASLGQKNGVQGTPGSFINGEEVKGALPYEQIKAIIDSKLNK